MSRVFVTYSAVSEECLVNADRTNLADIQDMYIGGYTSEGTSLLDLLVTKNALAYDDNGRAFASNQKRSLITHFCDVVLRTRDEENMQRGCFDYDTWRYDPRQSLFVYALCVNVDDKGGDRVIAGSYFPKRNRRENVFQKIVYPGFEAFDITQYIQKNFDSDLNSVWGIPTNDDLSDGFLFHDCNPATSMQACDFSSFVPHIFNTVINAYFNMKLVSIYGYNYVDLDSGSEEQFLARRRAIIDFSRTYFSSPIDQASKDNDNECNAEGVRYLSDEPLNNKQRHCRHPKVYTMLNDLLKSLQQIVKNIKYIDANTVFVDSCESPKENLFACAFSSTGTRFGHDDRKVFQNLLANELMRFSIFSRYYVNQIEKTTRKNPLTISDYHIVLQKNQEESFRMQHELVLARKSLDTGLRYLKNIATTFPIHVGLLAYREDIEEYRSVLARIYTPLHQLLFLWPNAQECQE